MLSRYFGSVKLIQGIVNPSFRRTLSAASIRYGEETNRKKGKEGVFSWLKDILKYDDEIQEARKASSDQDPVTILDYPEINRTCSKDSKRDRMDDRGSIPLNSEEYPKNNGVNREPRKGLSCQNLLVPSENMDTSIRTIMDCAPGNTKPPIREPNMPEKQEKKDDKKDKKKKKKPVIRMEGGTMNDSLKTKDTLHDNMDVNFRHQWGVRLPEEVEKLQSMELRQPDDSSFQVPVYGRKNLQVDMSSSKNSEVTMDTKKEEQTEKRETADSSNLNRGTESSRSSTKTANVSSSPMDESNAVDEDYNVPAGTKLDAEVSAWKELVLRSKVRLAPSKEELVPADGRRAEMLSIRPEPPRPKLDVQAVPTSNEQPSNEMEDEDFSTDVRTTVKGDTGRTGNFTDVQKSDKRKLHTGSTYSKRINTAHSRRSPRSRGFLPVMENLNNAIGFISSQRTFDFSTSTDSSCQQNDQATAKETEQSQNIRQTEPEDRFDQRSSNRVTGEDRADNREPNVANRQDLAANFEQQTQSRIDSDLKDSLNRVTDSETEITMNSSREENQDTRATRNLDEKDESRSLSDDFQSSFDYASMPYEDDFYPAYESVTFEPVPEKSIDERSKKSEQVPAASGNVQRKETIVDSPEELEYGKEYVSDGNYIRIPGDPYPYSREHFNKWRSYERENPSRQTDVLPSLRDMHTDAPVSTEHGVSDKGVRN
ncbi:uncharacterized protein LOC100875827 [Megachile rotundata]|uniref:uncharacterized protein LOC100875827 n=1 Tax=Megachile rotundata TaxID=143995 RepID=UPI003FCF871A